MALSYDGAIFYSKCSSVYEFIHNCLGCVIMTYIVAKKRSDITRNIPTPIILNLISANASFSIFLLSNLLISLFSLIHDI